MLDSPGIEHLPTLRDFRLALADFWVAMQLMRLGRLITLDDGQRLSGLTVLGSFRAWTLAGHWESRICDRRFGLWYKLNDGCWD